MGAKVFKGIDKYHLCDKSFKRFLLLLYEIINLSKDCTV
jgi:hypothetical protein